MASGNAVAGVPCLIAYAGVAIVRSQAAAKIVVGLPMRSAHPGRVLEKALPRLRSPEADADSFGARVVRRAISIPGYFVALVLWIALAPLTIPLAFVLDLLRGGRSSVLRLVITIGAFFGCEIVGLAIAAWIGLSGGARDLDRNFKLQWWWAGTLLDITQRLFDMKIEVQGIEHAKNGPLLVLLRHASTGDTLIPAALISRRTSLRLRYVLKRELLWDPCLDIVGRRLPNAFVRRGSPDPAQEVALVAALADQLNPNDGVLIYPEGTRFSPQRREAALAKLETAHPDLAPIARNFSSVLPPRLGGTLALIEAAPTADVLFVSHVGFDGVRRISDVWNGVLLEKTIKVSIRRVARQEIPKHERERAAWLFREWALVDAWVNENRIEENTKLE
jgi:1-acyl-sn-glycerol-3-phosphate acyltransferase